MLNEMRIMNGLKIGHGNVGFSGSGAITRPAIGCDVATADSTEAGSVLDYVVASEAVVGAFATLNIVSGVHGSDHRPVHFTWRGKFAKPNLDKAPVEKTSRTTRLMGWRFIGNPSVEQKKRVAVLLRNGQAAAEVLSIL